MNLNLNMLVNLIDILKRHYHHKLVPRQHQLLGHVAQQACQALQVLSFIIVLIVVVRTFLQLLKINKNILNLQIQIYQCHFSFESFIFFKVNKHRATYKTNPLQSQQPSKQNPV